MSWEESDVHFSDEEEQRTATFRDVRAIAASEKAVLCEIPEHGQHWIPLSQITDDSEVWKKGDHGKLVITEWLANEKGIGEG